VGAPILFVIDQPPPEAARTGQYPSGPELALLDDIVSKGLRMDPGDVYVTPLAKCPRPDPDYQDTYPLKACAHVAHREIELVRPKAVVAMGRLVPGFLGGLESLSFDSLRSKKLTIGPRRIPLKATYDLATILESLDCKRLFWEDLKAVMRLL
jgi:uracil-DNA glycosylase family 4